MIYENGTDRVFLNVGT